MNFLKKNLANIAFAVFLFSVSPFIASAYIDLGTGSFIVQAVLATFFGVVLAIKIYWQKVKKLFSFRSAKQSHDKKKEGNNKLNI